MKMSNDISYSQMDIPGISEHKKYLARLLWQKNGCIPQVPSMLQEFRQEIILRPTDTIMMAIPAPLYTLQNNLLILAVTNLDAATYQVTYQLKILTTAGFSFILLGKQLVSKQWLSLLLLLKVGVSLVQLPTNMCEKHKQDQLVGCLAVLTACFSSGFAGVFYEKLVMPISQPSVIIRNLQLGIFSLLFSSTAMLYYNSSDIFRLGLFYGYSGPVIAVICLQAFGGLVGNHYQVC